MTEKLCMKCAEVKDASQFYVSKHRPDGLSSYCRQCLIAYAKERYNPHPRYRPPEGQKWCPGCKELKALDTFGANRRARDGKQPYCKPCSVERVTRSRHKDPTSHRESSRRWRERNPERNADNNARWLYGVEHGTYAKMLEAHGGRCAICGTDEPGGRAKRLHIDHCHTTHAVRGLLCSNCNNGLGRFKHSRSLLQMADAYLAERGGKGGA